MSEYKELGILEVITLFKDGCKDVYCSEYKIKLSDEYTLRELLKYKYRIKQTDFDKFMEDSECLECDGLGRVYVPPLRRIAERCPKCNGTGKRLKE